VYQIMQLTYKIISYVFLLKVHKMNNQWVGCICLFICLSYQKLLNRWWNLLGVHWKFQANLMLVHISL